MNISYRAALRPRGARARPAAIRALRSGQVHGFEDAGAEEALVHAVLPEAVRSLSMGTLPSRVVRFKCCHVTSNGPQRVHYCDLMTFARLSTQHAASYIKLRRMHRLAAWDPTVIRDRSRVVQGSQDEVVPHGGRAEKIIERLVRGTCFSHRGHAASGGQAQSVDCDFAGPVLRAFGLCRQSPRPILRSCRGACRCTSGVRPGLALRELLQRGVREALAGCVDGLRVRPGGQRRINRRDVIDNTRESDVIRPDVVPTSGRA